MVCIGLKKIDLFLSSKQSYRRSGKKSLNKMANYTLRGIK